MGSMLHDVDVGKDFLTRAPFAQELRPKADKQDFIKLKGFCRAKETISWVKRKPIE